MIISLMHVTKCSLFWFPVPSVVSCCGCLLCVTTPSLQNTLVSVLRPVGSLTVAVLLHSTEGSRKSEELIKCSFQKRDLPCSSYHRGCVGVWMCHKVWNRRQGENLNKLPKGTLRQMYREVYSGWKYPQSGDPCKLDFLPFLHLCLVSLHISYTHTHTHNLIKDQGRKLHVMIQCKCLAPGSVR